MACYYCAECDRLIDDDYDPMTVINDRELCGMCCEDEDDDRQSNDNQ